MSKPKEYNYFIAYNVGDGGSGNAVVTRPAKILSIQDLKDIAADVEKSLGLPKGDVIIINFILFDEK